jgi:hypothetical protein
MPSYDKHPTKAGRRRQAALGRRLARNPKGYQRYLAKTKRDTTPGEVSGVKRLYRHFRRSAKRKGLRYASRKSGAR